MLSRAKIKYIQSLHRKKSRQRYGKFLVQGHRMVMEALSEMEVGVDVLVGTGTWLAQHTALPKGIEIIETDSAGLRQISTLSTPNEVLLVADQRRQPLPDEHQLPPLSLYLDSIQDPGNLGTILRIADWFGISHVFLGNGTVDLYNPKTIQATMGAFLRVDAPILPAEELLSRYPGTRIMGADMQGEDLFTLGVQEKRGIVVIGNEGNGISPYLRQNIRHWVSIPKSGGAESLNAGVAAGIICAVLSRERHRTAP